MKILVVDDSRAMRMILARALRQTGGGGRLDIVECATIGDAVAELDGTRMLFTEWVLPGMIGPTMVAELRDAGYRGPVVFVTAEPVESNRCTAIRTGAAGMLAKPVAVPVLDELLRRFVR